MQEVKIFIQTGIKSIRPADGAAGYLLEAQTKKGPATLSRIYTIKDATVHAAELSVLIEAVKRIKEPCSLIIFTESTYIALTADSGYEHRAVVDRRIVDKTTAVKGIIGSHEFSIGIPDKKTRRGLAEKYYLGKETA